MAAKRRRSRHGSTLLEFAIILGLILLSAIAALAFLGTESRRTFALLERPANATLPQPDDQRPADPYAPPIEPAPAVANREFTIDLPRLTALFSAVALIGYGFLLKRQRSRCLDRDYAQRDARLLAELEQRRFVKRQDIFKVLSSDPAAMFEKRKQVRQLMTDRLETISPHTPTPEVRELMSRCKVRHVPVVDAHGALVGIVSDRDVLGRESRRAEEVMSRRVLSVSPLTDISPAVTQMIQNGISCLPVVEGDRLVGLLTTTDLIMALQCALQLLQRPEQPNRAARTISGDTLHPALVAPTA